MSNKLQILRSSVAGKKVTAGSRPEGTPWVNFADKRFGVIGADPTQVPVDLLPVTFFTDTAKYKKGDIVADNGKLYKAKNNLNPLVGRKITSTDWDEIGATSAVVTVGPTAPASPSLGDLWYDNTKNAQTHVWDGANWKLTSPVLHATTAPANPTEGQLWYNPSNPSAGGGFFRYHVTGGTGTWQDLQSFYVKTTGGDTITGTLTVHDLVIQGDITDRGHNIVAQFDQLVLTVSKTGTAAPTDPIGDEVGSGDHFNSLYTCLTWAARRISASRLYIIVHAGTYTNWPGMAVVGASIGELFIYGDDEKTTKVSLGSTGGYGLNFNGSTLRVVGIHFTGPKGIRSAGQLQIGAPGTSPAYISPRTPAQHSVTVDSTYNTVIGSLRIVKAGATFTSNATTVGAVDNSITYAQWQAATLIPAVGTFNPPVAGVMYANGWSRLSNGAVLQYLTVNIVPGQVITYPVAFKSFLFTLNVSHAGGRVPPNAGGQLAGPAAGGLNGGSNLTGFTVNKGTATGVISVLAIGF